MMKRLNNSLLLLLILTMPLMVKAETVGGILAEISINNLELQQLKAENDAEALQLRSSNNLPKTDIDFSYLFGSHQDKIEVGISQGFDWPGLYRQRGKAIDATISAQEMLVVAKRLDVLSQASELCMQIIGLNKQLDVERVIKTDMQQLMQLYNKGYSKGEITILDINKLKIEILNIEQSENELLAERELIQKELESLNGGKVLNIAELSQYPQQPVRSLEDYISAMEIYDPMQKHFALAGDALNKDVGVAKAERLPSFALGYKYAREEGDNFNGVTASIGLPIFSNRNRVAAAKSKVLAHEYAQRTYNAEVSNAVKKDYEQMILLGKQIEQYRQVLGNSDNIRILKKSLDGGQITLLDYIVEVRYFTQEQIALVKKEQQYNQLLSKLNKFDLL